jgi:hypothetical protein
MVSVVFSARLPFRVPRAMHLEYVWYTCWQDLFVIFFLSP